MENPKIQYDNSSIESLQGADQVRKKPANTFGTVDVWGAFHTAIEILANTFDEVRAISKSYKHDKYSKEYAYKYITVDYTKDRELTVQDFGRGVPMAYNPNPREMKYNWHMVFNLLYAGGKYKDELDSDGNATDSAYAESLGTNGLGATATQYASEYMIAESRRDGKLFRVEFRKGKPLTHYIYKGQLVKFVLDMEFKELYHVGAEIQAVTEEGTPVTVVLEDFDPFDKSLGYKLDFDTAATYGLQPRVTQEMHPDLFRNTVSIAEMQNYRNNGEGLVDNIFEKLYHTVMMVEELPEEEKDKTGTKVTWKLDNEVFHDTDFTFQMFEDLLLTQAHVVSADIRFRSEVHNVDKVYEGVSTEHYFKSRIGESNIINVMEMRDIVRTGVENNKPYRAKCDVLIAMHEEGIAKDLYLHNTSLITEEVHPAFVERALARFFALLEKRTGLVIKQHEYRPYFSIMAETYMNANATSYKNQTKKGISNLVIGEMIETAIFELLEGAYARNEENIVYIVGKILTSVRERKEFEEKKANANLVKKTTGSKHKVKKITPCSGTIKDGAELIIVEGDSAEQPVVNSRDPHTQAVYTSRGKIINVMKKSLDKVLRNDIVKDLIHEIGVGVDLGDRDNTFGVYNYKKLRYKDIIIMTDADKDGFQIRVLLFLVFYVLMPDLVEKGHVHICETPLFRIVYSNGKLDYAYDSEELERIVKNAASQGLSVERTDRLKGLGGFNPGELRSTAMDKEKRRLIPLQMSTDYYAVRTLIDTMFGEDSMKKRKEIILSCIGMRNGDNDIDLNELTEVFDVEEKEIDEAV